MTSGRDDATLRRYREANAALDERPSEATRATILAAAAREVNARPVSADAPRPVARRRWPLAMAATVLLSTLAALVATRTEQEMPTFNAPADRTEEKVAVAPAQHAQLEAPSTAAPAASADSAASDKSVAPAAPRVAPAPTAPSERLAAAPPAKPTNGRFAADPPMADSSTAGVGNKLSKTAPAAEAESNVRAVEESRSRSDAPQPATEPAARAKANEGDARGTEAQSAEAKRRAFPGAASGSLQSAPSVPPPAPAAPPASTPPPAVAGAAAAPQSQAAGRDMESATDRLKREQAEGERAAARRDAAPAPVLQGAARQEAAPKESAPKDYEASPDAWLDYIVRLRRDGRHDEADAELKRLRERFPDVRVPPAALRPTGTR